MALKLNLGIQQDGNYDWNWKASQLPRAREVMIYGNSELHSKCLSLYSQMSIGLILLQGTSP